MEMVDIENDEVLEAYVRDEVKKKLPRLNVEMPFVFNANFEWRYGELSKWADDIGWKIVSYSLPERMDEHFTIWAKHRLECMGLSEGMRLSSHENSYDYCLLFSKIVRIPSLFAYLIKYVKYSRDFNKYVMMNKETMKALLDFSIPKTIRYYPDKERPIMGFGIPYLHIMLIRNGTYKFGVRSKLGLPVIFGASINLFDCTIRVHINNNLPDGKIVDLLDELVFQGEKNV